MGRRKLFGEFSVNSKGHCFLCLNKISQRNVEPLVYSLQYLSHYLRMDTKKVFTGGSPIPPQLAEKVINSTLKAELCGECAKLVQKFSNLYAQLEKIKMEVGSCLSHIHERLSKADELGKTEKFLELVEDDYNFRSGGLLEMLGALRTEATQRCSQRLRTTLPRVQIPVPSKVTVKNEERPGFRHHYRGRGRKPGTLSKTSSNRPIISSFVNPLNSVSTTGYRRGPRGKNRWSMNPVTGKRTCNLCPYEFNTYPAFHYHYAKVHLQVKHQCNLCDKQFPYKASLHLHFQSVHQGLRFECKICHKSFTQNAQLSTHRREGGCKAKSKAKVTRSDQTPFYEDNIMSHDSLDPNLNLDLRQVKMEAYYQGPNLPYLEEEDPLQFII